MAEGAPRAAHEVSAFQIVHPTRMWPNPAQTQILFFRILTIGIRPEASETCTTQTDLLNAPFF